MKVSSAESPLFVDFFPGIINLGDPVNKKWMKQWQYGQFCHKTSSQKKLEPLHGYSVHCS